MQKNLMILFMILLCSLLAGQEKQTLDTFLDIKFGDSYARFKQACPLAGYARNESTNAVSKWKQLVARGGEAYGQRIPSVKLDFQSDSMVKFKRSNYSKFRLVSSQWQIASESFGALEAALIKQYGVPGLQVDYTSYFRNGKRVKNRYVCWADDAVRRVVYIQKYDGLDSGIAAFIPLRDDFEPLLELGDNDIKPNPFMSVLSCEWGIPLKAVEARFPYGTDAEDSFYVRDFKLGEAEIKLVIFYFSSDGLNKVDMQIKPDDYSYLFDIFKMKYGEPGSAEETQAKKTTGESFLQKQALWSDTESGRKISMVKYTGKEDEGLIRFFTGAAKTASEAAKQDTCGKKSEAVNIL